MSIGGKRHIMQTNCTNLFDPYMKATIIPLDKWELDTERSILPKITQCVSWQSPDSKADSDSNSDAVYYYASLLSRQVGVPLLTVLPLSYGDSSVQPSLSMFVTFP